MTNEELLRADAVLDRLMLKGDAGDRGKKGEKGEQGERGEKGERGEQGERGAAGVRGLQGNTGEQGPRGLQGLQGLQGERGKDGIHGLDGTNGKDGKPGTQGLQGNSGKDGRAGKDGSPDTAYDIVEKLMSLKGDDRLDASAIRNLSKFIGRRSGITSLQGGGFSMSVIIDMLKAAGFAPATTAISGNQEKSTTVPNGALTTFSFAHTPNLIHWNGAFQTVTDDYTVSGLTITFTASAGVPLSGDKIINVY